MFSTSRLFSCYFAAVVLVWARFSGQTLQKNNWASICVWNGFEELVWRNGQALVNDFQSSKTTPLIASIPAKTVYKKHSGTSEWFYHWKVIFNYFLLNIFKSYNWYRSIRIHWRLIRNLWDIMTYPCKKVFTISLGKNFVRLFLLKPSLIWKELLILQSH